MIIIISNDGIGTAGISFLLSYYWLRVHNNICKSFLGIAIILVNNNIVIFHEIRVTTLTLKKHDPY
jgi:hypothetical protein